jgi:hypothetical protein
MEPTNREKAEAAAYLASELLRQVIKHARPAFPKTPYRLALEEGQRALDELDKYRKLCEEEGL